MLILLLPGTAAGLVGWNVEAAKVNLFFYSLSIAMLDHSLVIYVHLKFLSQLGEGAGQEVQAKVGRLPLARVKEGSLQTANSEQIEG